MDDSTTPCLDATVGGSNSRVPKFGIGEGERSLGDIDQ